MHIFIFAVLSALCAEEFLSKGLVERDWQCVSLLFPPYHRAYLWTVKNWGRGVTEWKEETEECGGEKQRGKGMESQAAE